MKNFAKSAGLLIAGVIVGLLISAAASSKESALGGIYAQVESYFGQGISVGPSGTDVLNLQEGTVNCTGAATVALGSTANYSCTIAGVVSGDKVFASLSTYPAGIYMAGAIASTTAGFIQVTLGNASTTAAIAPTGATTSVQYLITR